MGPEVVVLARGERTGPGAALAVRLALALTLGDCRPLLILEGSAAGLGLAASVSASSIASQMPAELAALLSDEDARVAVRLDSLTRLGWSRADLREGVEAWSDVEIESAFLRARHRMVL